MSEHGDTPAGAGPMPSQNAAPAAGGEANAGIKDIWAERAAPESGPLLKPNDELAPETYAVGQVLAGKYRVDRLIGEGAMGLVLAATHLGLDEVVAIKFMRAEVQRLPGTLSRFAKEAKIAARIRNEHVLKVIDVGVAEPIGPYIVMEHLDGRSLADLLDDEGPLPVQRAAEYLLQVCEGLAAAHALGVTHRDIKPENLFITGQPPLEVVKVLDFGISKATLTGRVFGDDLALDKSSYVMGTPLYMSPEQIRAAPHVDSRTDIWSMGAVLYELVSGKTAFSADSMTEICAKILETPAPRLVEPRSPELAAVQAIIERCLEKEPERRYQSVAELAVALLPLASEQARAYADRSSNLLGATRRSATGVVSTSSAPRELRPLEAERPRRRSWLPLAALALVMVGLVVAAVVRFSATGRVLIAVPQTLNPAAAERSPKSHDPTPSEPAATAAAPSASEPAPSPISPPAAREGGGSARSKAGSGKLARASAGRGAAAKRSEGATPSEEPPAVAEHTPAQAETSPAVGSASPSSIRLVDAHARVRLVAPPPLLPSSSTQAESKPGATHASP